MGAGYCAKPPSPIDQTDRRAREMQHVWDAAAAQKHYRIQALSSMVKA